MTSESAFDSGSLQVTALAPGARSFFPAAAEGDRPFHKAHETPLVEM